MARTITITLERDGFTAKARATYDESTENVWQCRVYFPCRHPDDRETSDPVPELYDMLDIELTSLEREHAVNAGPYSDARCA